MMAAKELADGQVYTESLKTSWRKFTRNLPMLVIDGPILSRLLVVTGPPRHIRDMTMDEQEDIREKWHILTEGDDIPPPIRT